MAVAVTTDRDRVTTGRRAGFESLLVSVSCMVLAGHQTAHCDSEGGAWVDSRCGGGIINTHR